MIVYALRTGAIRYLVCKQQVSIPAVAEGQSDAVHVCLMKSYRLFHETQLPQSEFAMSRVTMNERTGRPM